MRTTKQKGTTPTQQDYSWINDSPTENEVETNDDGSQFIPIPIVENLLYKLDANWGTENFKFRIFTIEERVFASSSVELIVTIGGKLKKLVGASTFEIFGGENVEAVSLSESTKNASKKIGPRFGKNLNGRGDMLVKKNAPPVPQKNGKQKPPAVEMQPDEKMQKQFNDAWHAGNHDLMNKIKIIYPNIQYAKPTTNVES